MVTPVRGTGNMPPVIAFFSRTTAARPGAGRAIGWILLGALHAAALAILLWSEIDLVGRIVFVLAWGATNFVWLMLLRRPLAAALLSLFLAVLLVLLSRFKHDILMMTVNFLDVMI